MAGNSYTKLFGILLNEVVHEKLSKSVYICKSYNEKINGTFSMWRVYITFPNQQCHSNTDSDTTQFC